VERVLRIAEQAPFRRSAMSDDVEDDRQLSEVLILAFSRMAEGAEQNPDRVSNVLISAIAARAILTALVSQRDERSLRREQPALAFMAPAGRA
jgi:hypothetical protein